MCILNGMHWWYDVPMSTERVTITLPADLVAHLDEIAQARGTSRSSVVREASARYVTGQRDQARKGQLETATANLLGFLDELRDAPVLDDRPVLDILRELRGGALGESGAGVANETRR